ncbi:MAG TPA: hypothetical protein VNG33_13415 [Polyangiaceae bacterium]|nr:hypothetical protein [Polyangiaceae bacterium]
MKRRFTYAAAGGVLFTLACGPKVEIGHGTAGTSSGGSGDSPSSDGLGGTNPLPQGGSAVFTTAGDAALGGDNTVSGGSASTTGGSASTTGGNDTSLVGEPGPVDNGPQATVGKVDLLLAVDNSISMAEKQQLFAKTVPALVTRLISPYCVNAKGAVVSQPPSPSTVCPAGSNREFAPLGDLHVGVITSSLGSHGASGMKDVCVNPEDDDHAHLLPFVRNNVASYDGKGYLNWDPQGLSSPAGESDVQAFTALLQSMITSVGEHGCGYEATLEAAYRFLVDPAPPKAVTVSSDQRASKIGTDTELLQERADFLRPDSSVVVLMLTDENDCSIQDEGYGWLIAHTTPMFRSTSRCHTNPNDTCCQSCAESGPNPGCPSFNQDSECQKGNTLAQADDDLNLRCFNQKGRFGFDLLYPTARYVNGFSGGAVPNRAGTLIANPLFHQNGVDRDPSLFTLTVVAGVPWQDLATTASLSGGSVEYQTPSQLTTSGRWQMLLGDPATNTPPSDPFMRESTDARSGVNPVTGAKIVAASSTNPLANPINGHEQNTLNSDLQFACTFELPSPLTCDQAALDADLGCDCFADNEPMNRSVCNPPAGGPASITQYYGKAYPGLRELTVAKELGRRSVLGSICAPNTTDEARPDYGYGPVFGALGQRLATTLAKP